MKKLIATAISIVASATLLASNASAYYGSTPYYVDIPTQDEIIEKYYELGMDKPYKTEYAQTPSTSYPFSAGALTDVSLQQALNTVNFIRFTAGIDEVSLDEGYCNLAQHASLVNAVTARFLTHLLSPLICQMIFISLAHRVRVHQILLWDMVICLPLL